ncbi:PREDICTED: 39S ribosomal protein L43, mitochondrial-like [Priapulus caudatus]|uniref:Large ribosomal subunit protein mL43 n=1 Tax=Priapulus caudatus TaxID=37621 RepID=A0ABM1DNN9_PRICU|nr:PREDICTED: 39S ribosomal protein L43, mitochondrial-like [Priapulus caudatus]
MSSATRTSAYLKNILQNGVGRYVCQLQRVTFQFCKSRGDSKGIRDFIETHLVDFAKQNAGVAVYVQPRRHRRPYVIAEYLNGAKVDFCVHEQNADEVSRWLEHLRTRCGVQIQRLRKQHHTDHPSIQGQWTPFVNLPTELNTTQFPSENLSRAIQRQPTATQKILDMAAKQQAASGDQGSENKPV